MRFRKSFFIALYLLAVLSAPALVCAQEEVRGIPKLIVFFSPSCHKCKEVKRQVLPEIEKEFGKRIEIEYRDISDIENYKLLLALREKYNKNLEIIVPVFFSEGGFLNGKEGVESIKNSLRGLIAKSLSRQKREGGLQAIDLVAYFRTFKPFTIVSAGLADGINPCAFTVIVFFVSFLALQGYRKKELIVIGLSFIFAVFLTYFLLGLGLFDVFYRLKGLWIVTRTLNILIGVFSIVLGLLSLYDFAKYKRTGSTEGMVLQLPQAVKNQIHFVVGAHYRKSKDSVVLRPHIFRLLLSALVTGFLVSLLEAVCTGQLYLPTITFVLKTTPLKIHALGYLLLYNFMFIVPLLIIFMLALMGVTSMQFAKFLKKHLLGIKIFMAVIFFALGVFLIWRA